MEPKEHAVSKERDDDGGERTEPANTAGESGTPEQSDTLEHADRAERRGRKPRLAVAAVAAAVLLAGGGGAWWAAAAGGGGGNTASPAPLRLTGSGLSAPVSGGSTGPTDGGGAAYRLTGKLPDGPDKAALYRASGSVRESDVRHLAALLGVSGPVTSDHDAWRVGGTTAGGGPSLLVSKSAPGTWSYTKNGPPSVGARPDPSGTSTSQGEPSPGATPSPTTPSGSTPSGSDSGATPVSAAKAEAVAKPVLDGLGLSGAAVDASQSVGAVRTVTADPKAGGLPTHGWSTSLEIGPDGTPTLGYGRLSGLAKGATYPVVSAAAALKELNAVPVMHPGYAVPSCRVPMPDPKTRSTRSTRVPTTPATPSATPTVPGQDKTLPHSVPCVPGGGQTTQVQVRGAAFGLALEYVSGVQTLVPAWLFDTAPAGVSRTAVVAQAAVDPSYIQGGSPGGTASTPPASPVSPTPGGSGVNPGGPEQPPSSASPGSPSNARSPHHVPVDGYAASGSTLTLTYSGGLCDTYKASASESSSQVKVAVVATPKKPGTICPMIIRSLTQKVTLEHPLGSRTVLDTSDGRPVGGQ
jgi:hypothetical protein